MKIRIKYKRRTSCLHGITARKKNVAKHNVPNSYRISHSDPFDFIRLFRLLHSPFLCACIFVERSIVRRISESSFQSNGDFSLKDGYQCLFQTGKKLKWKRNVFIVDVVSQAKQQMTRFFGKQSPHEISVNLMVHHLMNGSSYRIKLCASFRT